MDNTLNKILEKLKNHPDIIYSVTDNSVTVTPHDNNGFPVTLTCCGDNYFVVAYDFWHEEFNNEKEALNCFLFGLSDECKLKVSKSGQRLFKSTVEFCDNGVWTASSTTGRINFTFWKKTTVDYLQNHFIKKASS